MAFRSQKRTRSERVAALELPPGMLDRAWQYLRRGDVLLRLGLCVLTILALWAVTAAWRPPLAYRTGYVPPRNISAKVAFQKSSTDEARERALRDLLYFYEQDK